VRYISPQCVMATPNCKIGANGWGAALSRRDKFVRSTPALFEIRVFWTRILGAPIVAWSLIAGLHREQTGAFRS
jgi:hypothetical protein